MDKIEYDRIIGARRDRIKARNKSKGGGMKFVGQAAKIAFLAVAFLALTAMLSAGPLMLVLGALHSTEALSFVPALGFWETLGSLFVIGAVGRAFNTTTSSKS